MFTGIIEATGTVQSVKRGSKAIRLAVEMRLDGPALRDGASLAVNGCCLTVVRSAKRGKTARVEFDLLRETWERTNLQFVRPGSLVNLERPLRADGRLDGHFVSGHVDGLGKIKRWEVVGKDRILVIQPPAELMRYVVPKGSIAVDGISLTVAELARQTFTIWIIPHTHEVTALRERKVGDGVNLEGDLLGKYVERFLKVRTGRTV